MHQFAPYLLLGLTLAGCAVSKPTCTTPKAKVINGTYAGVYSREFKQDFFLGMPYAKTAERFTVAEGLDTAWGGTRDAKEYPPHCIGYGGDNVGYEQSEDCLYINVIRPAGIDEKTDLPVAAWIHGGGLEMGGSADRRYNLSFIVEQSVKLGTPMIGVSFNYRLSAFGFLNGKEAVDAGIANIGFRDQRLALQWVQENIAAFGGSPKKVTIWGESSGAESVSAQVLAYNGRDDGLFRAAIGQSGFGGMLNRLPGGFNATQLAQMIYDGLVSATSCADTVGTPGSIDCLRKAPFEEINAVLESRRIGQLPSVWPPVLDGDFFQDYSSNQLHSGNFVQVPLLTGTNSDEGTGFGMGRGPNGGPVNTDEEFTAMLLTVLMGENTEKTAQELAAEVMKLYPNNQSVGIPSLETWDHIIQPGDPFARQLGLQYRRVSSLIGDYAMHYLRRRANLAWNVHEVPSYAYRFDVMPNGIPDFIGAVHFQEVAFVFLNLNGDGYEVNPFGGDDEAFIRQAKELSGVMSTAWINFITELDPNGANGLPNDITWPAYEASTEPGQDLVWDLGESTIERDDWRQDGMAWLIDHSLSVFGN